MRTSLTALVLIPALAFTAPLAAQRRNAPPKSAAVAGYDSTLFNALTWRSIGPFRGGRSTAVTGVVGEPYVYYFGGTGGGVWKTVDGGMTWDPVSDSVFTAGSIGAIAVAASDPNVVYVGTGESPIRGNVSPGDGIYKSTDAGKTWVHLPGLRNTQQIAEVRIHPTNPDLVYVAALGHVWAPNAERGIFRSKDGGKTWDKILFRNDSTGAIDLAIDPANPRILYAAFWQAGRTPWSLSSGGAGSGLFKSTDGGDTWREITRNEGLPKGVIGKIGVTVSPVNHDRVWAIVEAEDGGVFRSDNGGDTWTKLNEDRRLRQRAWYYTEIFADPKDDETVYVENTSLYRSVDGGRTYTPIPAPHGDNHDFWIDPENPQRMINANDGGATISYNGGATWSTLDNQPTAQFYHVTATTDFPYKVCGAQQDNTTVCIASQSDNGAIGVTDWYVVGGCESGYIASRPDDPDVSYAGCYGGYLDRHDRRTNQDRNIMVWPDNPMGWGDGELKYRFQWTYPIVLSPQNPHVLYTAAQVLFKTTNEGQTWTPISKDLTRNDKTKQQSSGGPITQDNTSIEYYDVIFTVAPSPKDSQVIWTGSDDGLIYITQDGGGTWTNVTPKELPAWSLVSLIEASPHAAGTAYAAVTAYKLDDPRPYIFKTTDFGKTWTKIVNGIPATDYIRVVREDPVRPGLLYAGGEFGIYVSFDGGANWQSLRLNLPVVPIHDLAVVHGDLVAATHGRAFWILDDITPLRQMADSVGKANAFLFQPRDAYHGGGGGFGRARNGVGANPPGGAVIYYTLKAKPDSANPVKIEMLDSAGAVIKTFASNAKERGERLEASAGMNRFIWNTLYPDAVGFTGLIMWGGGTRGPAAPPGTYQVRLTAAGVTSTRSFHLLKDPRVPATQADLDSQFALLIKIRDRLSDANRAVVRIRQVKDQVKSVLDRLAGVANAGPIRARGDSLTRSLSTIEEAIYQVKNRSNQDPLNFPIRINNKIAALGSVVSSADAKPTDQSYQVFDDLSAQLQTQLDKLRDVVDTGVPAFNALVKAADIPAVNVRERGRGGS